MFSRAKTYVLRMDSEASVRQVFKILCSPCRLNFCTNNVCNYALLKILAFSMDSDP